MARFSSIHSTHSGGLSRRSRSSTSRRAAAAQDAAGAASEEIRDNERPREQDSYGATGSAGSGRAVLTDDDGSRVDFVVEAGGRLLAVEVKGAATPGLTDTRDLCLFARSIGISLPAACCCTGGREMQWMAEGVLAVPWWRVV